jgi:hypothetical protein
MLLFVLAAVVGLVLYFAPFLIALAGNRRNLLGIGALNLLLGWTVVGWIVAFLWAVVQDAPVAVAHHPR